MRNLGICALVVAGILLSGCGGQEATAALPAPVGVATAGSLEDGGVLEGIVVDDSQSPLADALVGLLELKVQVVTGESGAFRFDGVPAGTYQLGASRLGFDSVAVLVDVAAADVTTRVLTLQPITVYETYHEAFGPNSGFFTCGLGVFGYGTLSCGVGPLDDNDRNQFGFTLSAPHYRTIYGELRWTPAAAGTTPALAGYITYEGGSAAHWWCASDGPSPNWFRYDVDEEQEPYAEDDADDPSVCSDQGNLKPAPHHEDAIDGLYMAADAGFPGLDPESGILVRLTYQQKYDAMVTVFYGEPAPDGYSGFPDA